MADPKDTIGKEQQLSPSKERELQEEVARLKAELAKAQDQKPTTLTAPGSKVKMVKVKAKRDFQIPEGAGHLAQQRPVRVGEELTVDADMAKSLTRVHKGQFSYFGERFDDQERHSIQLAEMVN